jgi:translation initiation factor 2 alpha subunit (eIF-2alpha)
MQFYPEPIPSIGSLVVATVQRIADTAVYCTLPAYRDHEVMLPTSEINVRRGRRVCDYVRVGQQIVVAVVRDDGDKLDVSLKQVREAERDAALEAHARAAKIALIVRSACGQDDSERVAAMYRDTIWPAGDTDTVYALFEEVKAGGPVVGGLPAELAVAIHNKMPAATYTSSADVTIRAALYPDGAARVAATLTRLASEHEGVEVFVVAPPKYRLTATDSTKARADARLAAAIATVPAPC